MEDGCSMREIWILEPWLDQSQSVARFLCKYDPDSQVIGAIVGKEEPLPAARHPFHELRVKTMEEVLAAPDDTVVFPTGHLSTNNYVERHGDLQLGDALFKKDNLRLIDKLWSLRTASDLGIPIPTRIPNLESIADLPVFYRSKTEGQHRRGIARTKSDIDSLENKDELIFEEYVNTPLFYGVYFLADEGNIITQLTIRSLMETPTTGGSSVVIERFEDTILTDYTTRYLERLGYSGWGMTEFKRHPSGYDYVFMELNAKLCSSVELLFLNQPEFLGHLFGIRYEAEDVPRIVFANRLLDFGLREYVSNIVRYAGSRFVDLAPSMRRALSMAREEIVQKVQ
jgi:hypothetical protein